MKLGVPGHRMVRDLLSLSGGEVLGRAAGFVAFAYLARVLEPEGFGIVELVVSLSSFFLFFTDFGLGTIGAREVVRDRSRVPELAAGVPAARLLLTLLAVLLMGLTGTYIAQDGASVRLVWLFTVALLAAPWQQLWLLQGLELMGWASLGNAVRMLTFAAGVLLFVHGPDDLLAVGAVEIAAASLLTVYFLAVQHRHVTPLRFSLAPRGMGRLYREGAWIGLSRVAWAASQYLPTILVASLVGSVETSWFGSANRIVLSLTAFSALYHFNLFPSLTRLVDGPADAFRGLIRSSFKALAWGGVLVALVLTIAADPVCRLVYGASFGPAAAVLAVLVWILPITLLSGHARWTLIARNRQRFVLIAQLAGALTILAGGWVLIPSYGARGAAFAAVAGTLVVWGVAHAFATRRDVPMPLLEALRPLAAAAAVFLAVRATELGPWAAGAVAGAVFVGSAPLLDPKLIGDLRRLAAAKEGVHAPRPPAP